MPGISLSQKSKRELVNRPGSETERARSTSSATVRSLRKSLSYQNLEVSTPSKANAGQSESQSDKPFKRPLPVRQRHHWSAANLPTVGDEKSGNSKAGSQYQTHGNNCNGMKARCNAQRISANSDLLSRIEKEKKQYESRISELTQVAETRKMEIEKLTFEIRRLKEEASQNFCMIENLKQENTQLHSRISDSEGTPTKRDGDHISAIESSTPYKQSTNATTAFHKLTTVSYSPAESLGTTTRLTPGGATTGIAGTVTTSSLSGDWNDAILNLELGTTLEYENSYSLDLPSEKNNTGHMSHSVSVATLQGRLLQMEEANYTTNEELQATLQELWDLQRSVDEAREEAHNLAFERAILLEALSTQTTKLEHCRFQIEQLKHLLLTGRQAQIAGSRENHFCELYASIEHEKQVLLSQNNDLAQSSDSLAKECRVLTEKASHLQDTFDRLESEHATLKAAYQSLSLELSEVKAAGNCQPSVNPPLHRKDACADTCFVTTNPPEVSSSQTAVNCCFGPDAISRLQRELVETRRERNDIREQLELLQAERERESTEWRLYERDLLKTVQVADGIKSEAEAEVLRLLKENESLKCQVDQLACESNSLSSQLILTKEKLNNLSKMEISPTKMGSTVPDGGSAIDAVRTKDDTRTKTSGVPNDYSTLSHHRGPSGSSMSDSPRASAFVTSYPSHRPTSYNHTAHVHSYSGSPGAPIRPSCLTNGPTVRSLIQSIENQVKAVQHQKRGLTTNTTCSLPSTPGTSSLRIFTRASCKNNPPVNTNDRPNMSTGIGLVSGANSVSVKHKLRNTIMTSCTPTSTAPSDHVKENASAPGGPGSRPPSSSCQPPNVSLTKSDDVPGRSRSFVSTKAKPTDSPVGPIDYSLAKEKTPHSVIEVNKGLDGVFSSPRLSNSLHETDLSMVKVANSPASMTSKHTSLERPLSPGNRLDLVSSRRYSSETAETKCSSRVTELSNDDATVTSTPDPPDPSAVSTASVFGNMRHFWPDPLQELARRTQAGSKRNALLFWCQSRVAGYRGVEVNNFSSSWNNGLALCALLHTYMPAEVPWNDLITPTGLPVDKRRCFETAFKAAEKVGIPTTLRLQDMLAIDRPDWNAVMSYVTSIYLRYEVPTMPNHTSNTAVTSTVSNLAV